MKKFYYIIIPFIFFISSCLRKNDEVMTPTVFSNGLINAAFTRDSSYFLQRTEDASKLRATIKFYKNLRPGTLEYENILMSDNSQYERMRDSAIHMYKGLVDSIQKYNIHKTVFDTVDFNNYINNYRPYYKLDADAYVFQGLDTFVLEIKEAILLADGWNLGSVRLFKQSPTDITIRRADSIREASKVDPRNVRIMDSLKKINYKVLENPLLDK